MPPHDRTLALALAALSGAGVAWGALATARAPQLADRVQEALLLERGHATLDARRLRYLVAAGDDRQASWARAELARVEGEAPRGPAAPPATPAPQPLVDAAIPVASAMLGPSLAVASPVPLLEPPRPPPRADVPAPPSPAPAAAAPPRPRPEPVAEPATVPAAPPRGRGPAAVAAAFVPPPVALDLLRQEPEPEPTTAVAPEPAPGPPPPEPEPEPEPVTGTLTLGPPLLDGDLDATRVQAALNRRLPRWQSCYDDALARDPRVQGAIELEFTLFHGRVTDLRVGPDGIRDPALASCLSLATRLLRLPGEGTVVLPLALALDDAGGTDD